MNKRPKGSAEVYLWRRVSGRRVPGGKEKDGWVNKGGAGRGWGLWSRVTGDAGLGMVAAEVRGGV